MNGSPRENGKRIPLPPRFARRNLSQSQEEEEEHDEEHHSESIVSSRRASEYVSHPREPIIPNKHVRMNSFDAENEQYLTSFRHSKSTSRNPSNSIYDGDEYALETSNHAFE